MALSLVGHAAFVLEKELTRKTVQRVSIVISQPFLPNVDAEILARELRLLFNLVLLRDFDLAVHFEIESTSQEKELDVFAEVICLFSGGVDSAAGILRVAQESKSICALFCSHADQSKIYGIVQRLSLELVTANEAELMVVRVPEIGKGRFAQLRGFLYLTTGLAVAWIKRSSKLVVSEVGPTMYQPRFGPLDQVTLTTHPYVIERALAVSALFGNPAGVDLLFEDSTKAEVMAQCSRPEMFPLTHSCITQRFGRHDGTCYGCVMRRLSAIAAGVVDVKYDRDPITDERANDDNLISLMDFCLDVLDGYEKMPLFRRENIDMFGKHDLFRRYSLDVYGSLFLLSSGGSRLAPRVGELYMRCLERVGQDVFEERIEILRSQKRPYRVRKRGALPRHTDGPRR